MSHACHTAYPEVLQGGKEAVGQIHTMPRAQGLEVRTAACQCFQAVAFQFGIEFDIQILLDGIHANHILIAS